MSACRYMDRTSEDRWSAKNQHGAFIGGFSEWISAKESAADVRTPTRPIAAYSKRSRQLAKLRSEEAWSRGSTEPEAFPPTPQAIESAERFINALADGCLEFRLAISHDGEINFFFGESPDLFQILIDESGALSYYASGSPRGEISASDTDVAQFPHLELLRFVDRNK